MAVQQDCVKTYLKAEGVKLTSKRETKYESKTPREIHYSSEMSQC